MSIAIGLIEIDQEEIFSIFYSKEWLTIRLKLVVKFLVYLKYPIQ